MASFALFGSYKEFFFLCDGVYMYAHVCGGVIVLLSLLIVDKYPEGKIIIDGVEIFLCSSLMK